MLFMSLLGSYKSTVLWVRPAKPGGQMWGPERPLAIGWPSESHLHGGLSLMAILVWILLTRSEVIGPLRTGSADNVKCFKGLARSVFQKVWGNRGVHPKFKFGAVQFWNFGFLCKSIILKLLFSCIHYSFTNRILSLHILLFFLNTLIKECQGFINIGIFNRYNLYAKREKQFFPQTAVDKTFFFSKLEMLKNWGKKRSFLCNICTYFQ